VPMDTAAPATASPAPYRARPGRFALVIDDLAALRGPAAGEVVLPLRLYWSPAGRVFDLGDPYSLRTMYEVVLQEAIQAEELASYLNAATLAALWPELHLPKGVRRGWEERHPRLRAKVAAA
jgi:hypothetical protein